MIYFGECSGTWYTETPCEGELIDLPSDGGYWIQMCKDHLHELEGAE